MHRQVCGRGRRSAARWRGVALAVLALAPALAEARPYRSQFELSRGVADPMDRVSVFVDWTASRTSYDATFDVKGTAPGFSSDITYKAKGYGTTLMVPRFGLTYAASERLLLEGSVGVSFYDFQERVVANPNYGNDHAALGTSNLEPGIALELGTLYTLGRVGDFQGTFGLRLAYRSASKHAGDDLSGSIRIGTTTTKIATVSTDEITLQTAVGTVSTGVEWRPRNTWLVNNFGVAVAYAYTFGKIKHSVKSDTSWSSSTVDISMTPTQYLGVYYGWSYFWPRVGVFGIEGQFLAEPRVTLTYEYVF